MRETKSLRREANQRVAAVRKLEVCCGQASLPQAVQGQLDTWNSASDAAAEASLATRGRFMRSLGGSMPVTRHYFLLEQPGHLMVTFAMRPQRMLERGFNPNNHGWLAHIVPLGDGDNGATRITIELKKWSVNDGSLIWNGNRYVQLLDGLVAGLNGRYISAPVDGEDQRFISQA
jgi:hypothetical protein